MMPDQESLDLVELARAAGVTPRTVRYYVQQGLLPSPGTRGRGTKYDRALIDRLQLIKLLQREHLPLAEIRRRLEALNDDGVRRALGAPLELPLASSGESALGYVRAVLARRPGDPHRVEEPRARAMTPGALMAAMDIGASRADTSTTKPGQTTRSTWERMELAPDVELHVRRPLSREQNRLVDRLLDAARKIFTEER